jgi:pilus assembly protein CpaF
MTTVHANSGRDAFSRIETMVMMASQFIPDYVIRQMMASAVQIVVHVARLNDGSRKVVEISEVTGAERDRVDTAVVFELERTGMNARGKVLGQFRATGYKPVCLDRLRSYGIHLPESLFREVAVLKDN